jgi:radical SAM protein with 4Fe4S-binding SPASM domain
MEASANQPLGSDRFTMQWHITDRCNLRCKHCYQGDKGIDPSYDELLGVLEQFRELVHRLSADRSSPVHGHINLTGGEPLVRPDLLDLVSKIKGAGFSFALLTNGTLIDDAVARELVQHRPSYVQISIDGVERTHDDLRGPTSYKNAMAGLEALDRAGLRTMVSFTAHRGNFRELEAVARELRGKGNPILWTDRMIPVGQGAAMASEVLGPAETKEYVELLGRARGGRPSRYRHPRMAMDRALQFLGGAGRPYRCTAGSSLLAVLPNGDVLPCRRMPISIGNLRERSLMDLYLGDRFLAQLRDPTRMDERCRTCAFGTVCHGGLRCLSFALRDDPFQADPGCWIAQPIPR